MSNKLLRLLPAPLVTIVILTAFGVPVVQAASSNIDPVDKWAWGTNIGWLNFNDPNGGVTVYADHLEGYVWAENIGWIKLGSAGGSGTQYYANTTKDNYGVNRDGAGRLSGFAWGTNVGWINFRPSNGGVSIDAATGSFDGYAWGENVGWIHFKNTASAPYNVVTEGLTFFLHLPFIRR